MANHMAEVAKLLGVDIGEEFECNDGTRCVFTSHGSFIVNHRVSNQDASNHILGDLLTGVLQIIHKPWRPKLNEYFWFVLQDGNIDICYHKNTWFDIMLYKLGNCYRTSEEAKENRDKWISFYASDEVLEV